MMINYFLRNSRAFTLTEAIIAVAIFILLVVALFSVYSLNYRTYQESERAAEIIQNGRVILERMTREIRQTSTITTNLASDESGATSTIMFQDGHDVSTIRYIHYFLDGTDIKREVLAFYFSGDPSVYVFWNATPPVGQTMEVSIIEDAKVTGEYVTNLGFWGPPVINVSVTLEKLGQQINLKTKIFGRNL